MFAERKKGPTAAKSYEREGSVRGRGKGWIWNLIAVPGRMYFLCIILIAPQLPNLCSVLPRY